VHLNGGTGLGRIRALCKEYAKSNEHYQKNRGCERLDEGHIFNYCTRPIHSREKMLIGVQRRVLG